MTINITCNVCDGRRLCEACRTAARTLEAAGHRIEHSTRHAALRAAAAGMYGFDACIVPVDSNEPAVVDAAVSLLAGKRLALVATPAADFQTRASGVAVLSRADYASGTFGLSWLTGEPLPPPKRQDDETATLTVRADASVFSAEAAADRDQATRRLKRVANGARNEVAKAELPSTPRLDLVAVLEDEVAWSRASGLGFGMILVHLPGVSGSPSKPGEGVAADQRVADVERVIARAVRSNDIVSGRGDDFLVVLPDVNASGVDIAMRRVEAAIAAAGMRPATKQRRSRGFAAWSIGGAVFPDDGATRDALLARATATLRAIKM